VGDRFFGIDVAYVQEVIRHQEITRVPLAPPGVTGLINLRGQIVTALDLRLRLGIPARLDGDPPMNVIVRTDDGPVSLLVDEIGDVLDVSGASWEPLPETLTDASKVLIDGVYKLKDCLLHLLDPELATSFAELDRRHADSSGARAR